MGWLDNLKGVFGGGENPNPVYDAALAERTRKMFDGELTPGEVSKVITAIDQKAESFMTHTYEDLSVVSLHDDVMPTENIQADDAFRLAVLAADFGKHVSEERTPDTFISTLISGIARKYGMEVPSHPRQDPIDPEGPSGQDSDDNIPG